jgi:hypothetical protein
MNYIRHLNGLFEKMNRDDRLTSYHISLYMSIFQLWNMNRFKNPVTIDRGELMELSRIGGRNTYARCMKELDQWGYIRYSPSGNFYTGWNVSCIRFDTGDEPGSGVESDTGTAGYSGIKNETGAGIRTDTGKKTGRKTGSDTGDHTEIPENTDDTASLPNITNSINKKKKKKKKKNPPKILKIQKEKFSYGTNPLHVENDKNYAEPL